jgi:hypothetical protein
MIFNKFLVSNKSIIEKNRILNYRLRKKVYIQLTKLNKVSKGLIYEYLSNNPFFLSEYQINAYSNNSKNEIIIEANRISENLFRDISGNIINIGQEIDWNKDYIYNFRWDLKHYNSYVLKNSEIATDVKHVWELSRFYHLVVLGQAYVITKDEKYVDKILNDIFTWIKQNPTNKSVNWTVSMEVSIRVVNLIQTINLIRNSPRLKIEIKIKLNNLIYEHGIYIWNNLEKGLNTNNHYLSNLVGLIWIAIYFEGANHNYLRYISRRYLNFALKQLNYELQYQIYEDGFSYEDSVSYHGLNTEMILLTINILEKNKLTYPKIIKEIAKKMVEALQKLLINQRYIPLFGDIDNGRLIICDLSSNLDKTDFGYLIRIAHGMSLINEEKYFSSPIKLNDSGLYRIFNEIYDVIVKCGKIGLNGLGGHAHNDQLSFILNVLGEQIIIDPGTGYYSGDYILRRQLRSTHSHNTLSIKNYEQNNIDFDLFIMEEKTNSEVLVIDNNKFEGKHIGYLETLGIEFTREININRESLIITDRISHKIEEECYINFIFNSDVILNMIDNNTVKIWKNKVELILSVQGGKVEILDQYMSKSYGNINRTKKIRILMETEEIKSTILLK